MISEHNRLGANGWEHEDLRNQSKHFDPESMVKLLGLLAHGIRLEIIECLGHGELDVTSIAAALELPVRAISHHLQILRADGLVMTRKVKTRHVYALTKSVAARNGGATLKVRVSFPQGAQVLLSMPA